jgi:hypothetical protein
MTFLGMLMYTYEILSLGLNNYLTPSPDDPSLNVATAAVITWFRVEIFAWVGILLSNILFMLFRTQIKPSLDATIYVDEKKKLPTIDTIVAFNEVASLFHTEFVPFFVGNCVNFLPDGG